MSGSLSIQASARFSESPGSGLAAKNRDRKSVVAVGGENSPRFPFAAEAAAGGEEPLGDLFVLLSLDRAGRQDEKPSRGDRRGERGEHLRAGLCQPRELGVTETPPQLGVSPQGARSRA